MVFEIETHPGASVTHHRSGRTATADASGVARVEVPPDEAVDRASHTGELTVVIPSTTFLRGEQRMSVSILVGFDPTPLASVPDAETRSWVLGFGALESENAFLLRLFDYQGESPQLGRVLVPPMGGMRWVGPPGTMLTLGPWTFTIPDAGELRWTPSDAELLALWRPAARSSEVDVIVATPGRPTERGRVTVSLEAAAEARIGAHLRAAGARETPAPTIVKPQSRNQLR